MKLTPSKFWIERITKADRTLFGLCRLTLLVLLSISLYSLNSSSLIAAGFQEKTSSEEVDDDKPKSKVTEKKQVFRIPSDSIVFPNTGKPAPLIENENSEKSDTEKEKKETGPMSQEEAQKLRGRIPLKITRYADFVLEKYDLNHNGQLDYDEWSGMPASPEKADINQDKIISLDEIMFRIANYGRSIRIRLRLVSDDLVTIPPTEEEQTDRLADETEEEGEETPAPLKRRTDTKFYVNKSRLPKNLPASFIERDDDGDAQLTLKEFAENPTKEQIRQFNLLDQNQDGLVTAKEFVKRSPAKKKEESDQTAAKEEPAK